MVIAAGLNDNTAAKTILQAAVGQLNATTAATIAQAMNNNPGLMEGMLDPVDGLDAGVLAEAVNTNGPFLTGLISNLDGSVIANALNAEAGIHSKPDDRPFLERLLGEMDGAALADTLSNYGYAFMVELLGSLDGQVVAEALNGVDAQGKHNLAEMIAYLNPYVIRDVLNQQSVSGGFLEQLWVGLIAYQTHLLLWPGGGTILGFIPVPEMEITTGPGLPLNFIAKILAAEVYIPPEEAPYPVLP